MAVGEKDDSKDEEARRFGEERGLPEEQILGLQNFLRESTDGVDPRYVIPAHLKYTVFPIIALKHTDDRPNGAVAGDPNIQGTAAILSHMGLFITAGHCVNVAFGEKDITGQNAHRPGDYIIFAVEYSDSAHSNGLYRWSSCPSVRHAMSLLAELELPGSNYPDTLGLGTARARKRISAVRSGSVTPRAASMANQVER